ncbi:MAG: hypothetical protein KDC38_00845 [Planctomycetes bacterium]|nr:hypothetical protein [Planctomycetota bacterium]
MSFRCWVFLGWSSIFSVQVLASSPDVAFPRQPAGGKSRPESQPASSDTEPPVKETTSDDTASSGSDETTLSTAERRVIQKFLAIQLETARSHFRAGRFELASRLADAILTIAPDVSFRGEARRLRRQAEARLIRETALGLEFLPESSETFPIEVLTGRLVVENLSDERIRVAADNDGPLGLSRFKLFEVYPDGSQWSTRGSEIVHCRDGSFRLDPHEVHRELIALDLRRGPRLPVLQLIEVTGDFRPTEATIGREVLRSAVPWERTEISVVAPELRDVEADPGTSLTQALKEFDTPRMAAAGFLWARELTERGALAVVEREETIDRLVACLDPERDRGSDRLVIRLLEAISGVEQRPTRETWIRWHADHRREG